MQFYEFVFLYLLKLFGIQNNNQFISSMLWIFSYSLYFFKLKPCHTNRHTQTNNQWANLGHYNSLPNAMLKQTIENSTKQRTTRELIVLMWCIQAKMNAPIRAPQVSLLDLIWYEPPINECSEAKLNDHVNDVVLTNSRESIHSLYFLSFGAINAITQVMMKPKTKFTESMYCRTYI